jgi:hypothetical protein
MSSSAEVFLTAALAHGARRASELTRLAAARGIALETLVRVRERLGVRARKVGATWTWELPL